MSQQPCRLTVGELRKIVTRARKDNHLTGPANKEQLIMLFKRHADMDESVGEVLEGPIRVPMLKVQRTMLRDMYHPKVSEMNRTALLRYIYMAAHTLGWEFPDMDDYTQRTRVGKACRESRPIGKGAQASRRHPLEKGPSEARTHTKSAIHEPGNEAARIAGRLPRYSRPFCCGHGELARSQGPDFTAGPIDRKPTEGSAASHRGRAGRTRGTGAHAATGCGGQAKRKCCNCRANESSQGCT